MQSRDYLTQNTYYIREGGERKREEMRGKRQIKEREMYM